MPSTIHLPDAASYFSAFSISSNHQLLCLSAHFLAILAPRFAPVAPSHVALPPFFILDYSSPSQRETRPHAALIGPPYRYICYLALSLPPTPSERSSD